MNGVTGVSGGVHPANTSTPASGSAGVPQAPQTAASADEAAVYEKGEAPAAQKTYTRDRAAIGELRMKDRAYIQNLQNLVSQLVSQINSNSIANGSFKGRIDPSRVDSYWDLLIDNGDGTFSFHPDLSPEAQNALIANAKEDISEDGYYGVKQTSQRIIDFAKAITGGDPSKLEDMRKSIQKGFDEVSRMFGGKLPQISYDTLDAVMKGLDEWAAATGAK